MPTAADSIVFRQFSPRCLGGSTAGGIGLAIVIVLALLGGTKQMKRVVGQSPAEKQRIQQMEIATKEFQSAQMAAWRSTETGSDYMAQVKIAEDRMIARLEELATGKTLDDVIARALIQHTRGMAELSDRYRRLVANAERLNAFDMFSARSRTELSRSIAIIKQANEASLAILHATRRYPDEVRDALTAAKFKPREIDEAVRQIRGSMNNASNLRGLELDGILFEKYIELGTLLRDSWGQWTVLSDGSISFNTPQLERRFDRIIEQIEAAIEESERLMGSG